MDTIQQRENEIIEEFNFFPEWMEKYEHLIELGKNLPMIEEEYKVDENLIKGCQSKVWLRAELDNGKMKYSADSDALITKGIIALMIRVLNDVPPEEVVDANLSFIDKIGLKEHLSPTRSNGLVSMIKQMKYYALAHQART
jgi:cysteine desulfuration protein SufE